MLSFLRGGAAEGCGWLGPTNSNDFRTEGRRRPFSQAFHTDPVHTQTHDFFLHRQAFRADSSAVEFRGELRKRMEFVRYFLKTTRARMQRILNDQSPDTSPPQVPLDCESRANSA